MKRLLPILVLLLASVGCTESIKKIPLFNPEARPLNRVASANELITELNHKVADYVSRGWVTQEQVNETLGPALDRAALVADQVEALLRLGEDQAGADKLETLDSMLASIREQLAALERNQSIRRRSP